MKNQNGFTLVELLVVLGIIATLSAIAIPNFKKYQERTYELKQYGVKTARLHTKTSYDYDTMRAILLKLCSKGNIQTTESSPETKTFICSRKDYEMLITETGYSVSLQVKGDTLLLVKDAEANNMSQLLSDLVEKTNRTQPANVIEPELNSQREKILNDLLKE